MFSNLIHLFFPKLCNGCNVLLLKNEHCICTKCRYELPFTHHHLLEYNEITQKFYGIITLEYASAMLYFENKGIVQQMIHNLKYRNQQEIGTILGTIYGNELKKNNKLETIDYIIPTPIHKKRRSERGYNQVTTFCEALSKELNLPIATDLLFRKKHTKTQTRKNKTDRASLNQEDFMLENELNYVNSHFLIVDDVITSGATIEAISKKLLQVNDSKISIVSIAYTKL